MFAYARSFYLFFNIFIYFLTFLFIIFIGVKKEMARLAK